MAVAPDLDRPRPPSTARAVWLMTGLHLCRWRARIGAQLKLDRAAKSVMGPPQRQPTPGKAGGSWPVLLLLGLMMLVCSFNIWQRFVHALGAELEVPRPAVEAGSAFQRMEQRNRALRETRFLQLPFSWNAVWPSAAYQDTMVSALGLVLAALAATQFFLNFGQNNKDLGKPEWHLEWYCTLPLPAWALLAGQLPGMVLSDLWVWALTGPLLLAAYHASGWGWASIPLAVSLTAWLSLLLCSLRLLAETALRLHLRASYLKNVQAVATVLGLLPYFGLMYLVLYPDGPGLLVSIARQAPTSLLLDPFALPAALLASSPAIWMGAPAAAGLYGIAVPVAALGLAGRMLRRGLVADIGGTTERHRPAPGATGDRWRFTGIVGKELLALARDRTLLVQVVFVPLMLYAFYFVFSPAMVELALASGGGSAALAFGVGAYALLISAGMALALEGGALWLLYSLPYPLTSLLARKAALWSSLAGLYTLTSLIVLSGLKPALRSDLLLPGAFALLGVPLMGVIACGLGALSTDPFLTETQRRVRPEYHYLYLLVAALYATGLALPGLWPKVVTASLVAASAVAVWQQLTEHLPFLLDPTALPPRQLTLADGLFAALAFSGIQDLIFLGLTTATLGALPARVLAFTLSGFVVTAFMVAVLSGERGPSLRASLGLRPGHGIGHALLLGLVGGGAASLAGLACLASLRQSNWLAPTTLPGPAEGTVWWVAVLAVGVAPLFEELIFRGLVFRGTQRLMPRMPAMLVSAGVFALVHPPISVAPVFVMGLGAAWAFERSGSLLAPITVHALYNAAMVSGNAIR